MCSQLQTSRGEEVQELLTVAPLPDKAGLNVNHTRQTVGAGDRSLMMVATHVWALLLACACGTAAAGRVLSVPVDGSHWNLMKILLKELNAAGHNVTVLRFSNSMNIEESSTHFDVLTVEMPTARSKEERIKAAKAWFLNVFLKKRSSFSAVAFWDLLTSISRVGRDYMLAIQTVFEDEELLKRLQDTHFDAVLADPFFPCGLMLARFLEVPLVLFGRWMPIEDVHFLVAPSPLSYVPVLLSQLTDRMTFLQRVKNVAMCAAGRLLSHIYVYGPYDQLCQRYLQPGNSIYTLYRQADIHLIKADATLDFPRPSMPNMVHIGGFHVQAGEPLPEELREFVEGAAHGVVVMSLGTTLDYLPQQGAVEVAAGLASLPQRVVWRYNGPHVPTLGNNTRLLGWLPQNALLGHPNTRAFISHGGENGLYEAIYHAVPVVGLPVFGDNYDNLLRLSLKGVAVTILDLHQLNRADLLAAVRTVTDDPAYAQRMRQLSRISRDVPVAPMQLAVFWTEYVMRHGGARHLQAAGTDLPFYKYHVLDVLAFLLFCSGLSLYLLWAGLRRTCRKLCGRKKKRD